MSTNNHQELSQFIGSTKALRCWYVSCGGGAGPTFQLALGDKVPRRTLLTNPAHPETYQRFEGEANLLVWCSWRLDGPERPLTSSDDTTPAIAQGLAQLLESTVEAVEVTPPAWDLNVHFSNGLRLHVFCDHVPGDPSFDGNWELWRQDRAVFVGPGERYSFETPSA